MSSSVACAEASLDLGAIDEMIKLNVHFCNTVVEFQKEYLDGLRDPLDKEGRAAERLDGLKHFLLSRQALVYESNLSLIGYKYGVGLFVPVNEWTNAAGFNDHTPTYGGRTNHLTDIDLQQVLAYIQQSENAACYQAWQNVVSVCRETLRGLRAYQGKQRLGSLGFADHKWDSFEDVPGPVISILPSSVESIYKPQSFILTDGCYSEPKVYHAKDGSLARMALELSLKYDGESLEKLTQLAQRLELTTRMASDLSKARSTLYQTTSYSSQENHLLGVE